MKKVWEYIIKIWKWLLKKGKLGITNVAYIAFVPLIVVGCLLRFLDDKTVIAELLAKVAIGGFIIMLFISFFEVKIK